MMDAVRPESTWLIVVRPVMIVTDHFDEGPVCTSEITALQFSDQALILIKVGKRLGW